MTLSLAVLIEICHSLGYRLDVNGAEKPSLTFPHWSETFPYCSGTLSGIPCDTVPHCPHLLTHSFVFSDRL